MRSSGESRVASISAMSTARTSGSSPARYAACITSAADSPPGRLAGQAGRYRAVADVHVEIDVDPRRTGARDLERRRSCTRSIPRRATSPRPMTVTPRAWASVA